MVVKTTPVFKVGLPTQTQVVKSVERVVAVFVVAALGFWVATPNPFSRASVIAAWFAGVTAVYQLIVSTVTIL